VSRLFDEKDETPYFKRCRQIVTITRIDPGAVATTYSCGSQNDCRCHNHAQGEQRDLDASTAWAARRVGIWADLRTKLRPDIGTPVMYNVRTAASSHTSTVGESLLVPLPMRNITDIMRAWVH
jgi:hypothetical protein